MVERVAKGGGLTRLWLTLCEFCNVCDWGSELVEFYGVANGGGARGALAGNLSSFGAPLDCLPFSSRCRSASTETIFREARTPSDT